MSASPGLLGFPCNLHVLDTCALEKTLYLKLSPIMPTSACAHEQQSILQVFCQLLKQSLKPKLSMFLWRPQAHMGSAPFCQLLGLLRGAAPALADGLPVLYALAQLAVELQPAERRNGGALCASGQPGDVKVRHNWCSASPALQVLSPGASALVWADMGVFAPACCAAGHMRGGLGSVTWDPLLECGAGQILT